MMIYKGKTESYMTCVFVYYSEVLREIRLRNNPRNWYCITKRNSNLLYILDKWKNWKVAE